MQSDLVDINESKWEDINYQVYNIYSYIKYNMYKGYIHTLLYYINVIMFIIV